MVRFLFSLIGFWSFAAFAIPCDCEVRIAPPLTASNQMPETIFKEYQVEDFSSYSTKNQLECRQSCQKEFQGDLPNSRLNALLLSYSETLISQGILGYNCTGLTTVKYPVRVRAKLGGFGLGNVSDNIQIITHEQSCF